MPLVCHPEPSRRGQGFSLLYNKTPRLHEGSWPQGIRSAYCGDGILLVVVSLDDCWGTAYCFELQYFPEFPLFVVTLESSRAAGWFMDAS